LRWQFDLAWSLLELHLNRLEPGDFLWQPAPGCCWCPLGWWGLRAGRGSTM
ncbi:MAG: hypothetical protein QOI86_2785, partial [Actinomycetota bacterium]|nr:hypothetical protein [Actinomycetota bacterium]